MMKKQFFSVLMIVVLLLTTLAGCQRNGAATDEEKKFVGFTLPNISNDFLLSLSESIEAAVEKAGARIQVDSADGDVTTQIEQIENYITMEADLIVVFAINGEAVANACQQALDEGISVVAFAVEISDGATSTVVSADDGQMGQVCTEMTENWIEESFPEAKAGEVEVLVLGSSLTPQIVKRTEGVKKIAENPKVTMKYVETENQDSVDECRKTVENAFTEYDGYDVIMCVTGTAAVAAEAFIASTSSPITDITHFGIFCIDETEEVISKIADVNSALRGTVSMGNVQNSVKELMEVVSPILNGEEVPERTNGTVSIITTETLQ